MYMHKHTYIHTFTETFTHTSVSPSHSASPQKRAASDFKSSLIFIFINNFVLLLRSLTYVLLHKEEYCSHKIRTNPHFYFYCQEAYNCQLKFIRGPMHQNNKIHRHKFSRMERHSMTMAWKTILLR